MSSRPSALTDAASRALVLRHARTLIDKTLAFFAGAQDGQLKLMRSYMFELIDARPHTTRAQNLRAAAGLLDKQEALFKRSLQNALREAIEDEIEAILPGSLKILRPADEFGISSGLSSMALLDVDEIERHLLVDRVSQRFNARYDAQLPAFTLSVGALFGQDEFTLSDNPFRPATLIRAHALAWRLSEFEPTVVEDFISVFDPKPCGDWAPLYVALTENLVRAGFVPRSAHRIKRASGADAVPAAGRRPPPANDAAVNSAASAGPPADAGFGADSSGGSGSGLVQGMAERARQFLHKLGFGQSSGGAGGGGSGSGAGGGGSDAVHVPADPGLLGFLRGLQAGSGDSTLPPLEPGYNFSGHNVLRQMRERDEVRRAPELDRGTIDALAEVFDYVFADPAIPVQLKYVIGRLQIPVLKAAMIDRDFFLTDAHPARQLVDGLAAAALAWAPESGDTDPLYRHIDGAVKRVLAEFTDDLELFRTLLAELQDFVNRIDGAAQEQILPVAQQQQSGEARDAALAHADEVIHQCIDAASTHVPLLPFLPPFLTTQWRQVVANAWMQREAAPADWDLALATMDQMIWSTQTMADTHDRAKLVALLPELVRTLNEQLDLLGWQGEERSAFTRNLISTHMRAIRSPKSAPAPLEAEPDEEQTQASKAALRELEKRRALHQAAEGGPYDALARQLAQGQWFDFSGEGGTVRRYRLGWISPLRTRLLFTNRDGFDAFVHSEREVATLLREGRLAMLDQQPIVARAIDQLMAVVQPQTLELA